MDVVVGDGGEFVPAPSVFGAAAAAGFEFAPFLGTVPSFADRGGDAGDEDVDDVPAPLAGDASAARPAPTAATAAAAAAAAAAAPATAAEVPLPTPLPGDFDAGGGDGDREKGDDDDRVDEVEDTEE